MGVLNGFSAVVTLSTHMHLFLPVVLRFWIVVENRGRLPGLEARGQ